MWFEHCELYLNWLDLLDVYFETYDTMPTGTKKEKEQKRIRFEDLMTSLKEKKKIEQKLDDLWGCDAGYP